MESQTYQDIDIQKTYIAKYIDLKILLKLKHLKYKNIFLKSKYIFKNLIKYFGVIPKNIILNCLKISDYNDFNECLIYNGNSKIVIKNNNLIKKKENLSIIQILKSNLPLLYKYCLIKYKIKKGDNINECGVNDYTPLTYVCKYFKYKKFNIILNLLLNNNADINLNDSKNIWTPLIYASKYSHSFSHINVIKILIYYGVQLNYRDLNNNTALIISTMFCDKLSNKENIQLLLENGANPDIINNEQSKAISYATYNSPEYFIFDIQNDPFYIILKYTTNINFIDDFGWNLFFLIGLQAFHENKQNKMDLIVNKGIDLNFCINNNNILMYFIIHNHIDNDFEQNFDLLLKYNININKQNNQKKNCLMLYFKFFKEKVHLKFIKKILNKNLDLTHTDNKNWTIYDYIYFYTPKLKIQILQLLNDFENNCINDKSKKMKI
jgi:hypothetical protein